MKRIESGKDTRGPQPRGKVTLRDVAQAVGVSTMTVSNVVNGRFEIVSDETRQRVERAVARLNYRPHLAARGLRLSAPSSIGIIIVSEVRSHISDPLVLQTIIGLSDRLQQDSFALLIQALRPDELGNSSIVRNIAADGMCLVLEGPPAQRRRSLELLCDLGHPVVLFQDTLGGGLPDMCLVKQDDFGAARRLAERVLKRGARKLVMLVPSFMSPGFEERERGFRAAVEASSGTELLTIVRCKDASFENTQAALSAHIKRRGMPDAVLGGNDQLGIAAIHLLTRMGRRVPEDVMVTGFNGFEIWRYSVPTLTTVQSRAYEMGSRAAAELLQRLATGKFRRPEVSFPLRILPGGSA